MNAKVRTCLWFDANAQQVVEFYVSLLEGSKIEQVFLPDPKRPPLIIDFTLAGTPYQALNGGPQYTHSEAASISVLSKDQAEIDRLWAALLANGGTEQMCGWLKDRFGVSWQIIPEMLPRWFTSTDLEAAGRAMQAMMTMKKIDIAVMEAAFCGS